jgi:sarcosine oxidase/sarcosine oxidase subunit beta
MKPTILIVGGGIAGLSTAWGLAKRGFAVELFEQGPLPNPSSSSHDEHRIIRHAYGEMQGYAHLIPQAFAVWKELWRALGRQHYLETGSLNLLRFDTPWYEGTRESLGAMGIGFRDVPLDRVAARQPMLNLEGVRSAVETDGAGMLFPVRIVTALVGLLGRLGVRLHAGKRVCAVDPVRGTVTANARVHEGDTVVVAAGAWADQLVPSLKGVGVPSRQAVLYLAPPPDLAEAWANAPVMIDMAPDGDVYCLPPRDGSRLKIGDHVFSRRGHPDEDRIAKKDDLARLWTAARACYRDLDRYAVLEPKACFYTVTKDERFVVRPLDARGWLISACSGHGFKFGALMGEGVAAAIAGERDPAGVPGWAAGLA